VNTSIGVAESANKTKTLGDSKFFDRKVYPNTVVSMLTKQHSQQLIDVNDLKRFKVQNEKFHMKSLVAV